MPTVDHVVSDAAPRGGKTRSDVEGSTARRVCFHVSQRGTADPSYRNADFATDAPLASDAPFASDAPREGLHQVSIKIASDAPMECRIAGRATYACLGRRRMRHR